jgi:uncharacterized membrane protein YqjE
MGPVNDVVLHGRRVLAHVMEMVRTRLKLFALDFEEERGRFISLLLMGGLALIFAGCALLMVILLIVVAFWETHRFAAIGSLLVVFLVLSVGLGYYLRRTIALAPPPFAATLQEIERDKESLKDKL